MQRNYWQFKNGTLAPMDQTKAMVEIILRPDVNYAWDRSLGAAVWYER